MRLTFQKYFADMSENNLGNRFKILRQYLGFSLFCYTFYISVKIYSKQNLPMLNSLQERLCRTWSRVSSHPRDIKLLKIKHKGSRIKQHLLALIKKMLGVQRCVFLVFDALVCSWKSTAALFNPAFFWLLIHIMNLLPKSLPKLLHGCDHGISVWQAVTVCLIFFCIFTI